MTRINVVPPEFLTNEWLIAEYRELPRVPNKIRDNKYNIDSLKNIPKSYTLGSGYELFFTDKLKYLEKRHKRICDEMDKRGINRTNDPVICFDLDGYHDYNPTNSAYELNISRLQERFNLRKKDYHFKEFTINSNELFDVYVKFLFNALNLEYS